VLLTTLVVLGVGETRESVERAPKEKLIHRGAIPPSMGFFASLLAIGGFLSLASLHAQEIGLGNASLPLFVYGAVVVTCRIAFARVPDRIPSLALGAAALAAIAAGMLDEALGRELVAALAFDNFRFHSPLIPTIV